ncbi:MAG: alkene reductase, partial [Leptospiraceae bacterium]|nr:alkene reductase [Leptospiraceae bacterium]
NDLTLHDGIHEQYTALIQGLEKLGPVYVHLVDHSPMGAPVPEPRTVEAIRKAFSRTLILSGGYNAETAEKALEENKGDLIAFGRPMLANPDLVERFRNGAALNDPDMNTFYTPGEAGYLDYPVLQSA